MIPHHALPDECVMPYDSRDASCNDCAVTMVGFINLLTPADIERFYNEFNARKWDIAHSQKLCTVAFAKLQGVAELISRFRSAVVARQDPSVQPVFLDPSTGGKATLSQVLFEANARLLPLSSRTIAVVARTTAAALGERGADGAQAAQTSPRRVTLALARASAIKTMFAFTQTEHNPEIAFDTATQTQDEMQSVLREMPSIGASGG